MTRSVGVDLLDSLPQRLRPLPLLRRSVDHRLSIDRQCSGRSRPRTKRVDEQPFSFSLRQLFEALGIFKLGCQSSVKSCGFQEATAWSVRQLSHRANSQARQSRW